MEFLFWDIIQSRKCSQTQVFSCEICEFFKNTFFYRTPPVAAFVNPSNLTWSEREVVFILLTSSKSTENVLMKYFSQGCRSCQLIEFFPRRYFLNNKWLDNANRTISNWLDWNPVLISFFSLHYSFAQFISFQFKFI